MKPYEDEAGNFPLREHALVEDHLFKIYVPRTPPRCFSVSAWSELALRAWANSWDDQFWPAAVFLEKGTGYDVPTCVTCCLN
jgi:hypothetical protein